MLSNMQTFGLHSAKMIREERFDVIKSSIVGLVGFTINLKIMELLGNLKH